MIIESKDNKKIKYLNKLRTNKFMNEEKKFVVEGMHLVNEAKKSGLLLETYSTSSCDFGVVNNVVSKSVMDYISTLPSKTDVIGIVKFIKEDLTLGDKIIILDDVQDPGNLGTIIRSAKAFNIDTVVLSLGCVKKYNEKVVRAAQGMLFKVNVVTKDLKYFIPYLKENGYSVYGTCVTNGTDISTLKKNKKIAVVMGNEGQGISYDIKKELDKNVYINMNDDCESLNVAVASSIIMYEINKKLKGD